MAPTISSWSELHYQLDFANVLPRRGERPYLAVGYEALASVDGDGGRIGLDDVQDQATQPSSPGPMNDGVDQGRADPLAPCFGRHPHGDQVTGVPDVIVKRAPYQP